MGKAKKPALYVCDGRNDSAVCRECEDGKPHEPRHNCAKLPVYCTEAGWLVKCRPVDGGGK